jgi:hypothetical protein
MTQEVRLIGEGTKATTFEHLQTLPRWKKSKSQEEKFKSYLQKGIRNWCKACTVARKEAKS